ARCHELNTGKWDRGAPEAGRATGAVVRHTTGASKWGACCCQRTQPEPYTSLALLPRERAWSPHEGGLGEPVVARGGASPRGARRRPHRLAESRRQRRNTDESAADLVG